MNHFRHRQAAHLAVCVVMGTLFAMASRVDVLATGTATADAQAVSLNGVDFYHRWSKQGQHEFTPRGDEDLAAWKEMVTINVHDSARTGEALADVANRIVANYKAHGHIMRTISKPRTDASEAEHFVAAVLQGSKMLEVVFARFLLHEGRGTVIVYSKRFYGDEAMDEMKPWFKANAVKIENQLVSWKGMPSIDVLKKLPESPR